MVTSFQTIEGYVVVKFEVASSSSFRDMPKNLLVAAEAEADIDDSKKRKRYLLSLDNIMSSFMGG